MILEHVNHCKRPVSLPCLTWRRFDSVHHGIVDTMGA